MAKLKVPEKIWGDGQKWRTFCIYVQCYFVTIATILGTGVLGLPITLSHSGIYPFLVSFIVGFMAQSLLVYFITDLLQRAYVVQLEAVREYGREENVPLYAIVDEDRQDDDIAIEVRASDGSVLEDLAGHVILPSEDTVKSPNLHMLADFFLGCGMKQLFDVAIILTFVAILVSFALAGSQAYAQILGISSTYVIPVFVWVLTGAIIFALKLIQPVVSVLTFLKGSVLLITVAVAFIPGSHIRNTINNDFSNIGQPFLMGTVALGGMFQTMPMLYSKIKPSKQQVMNYRRAIVAGLATCTILNILWCWAVLEIVPQVSHTCPITSSVDGDNLVGQSLSLACRTNISLERAGRLGHISTVPLTQIIEQFYPMYKWIAVLTQVFIMVSITVSYLTIGAAMHHTLCGWIEAYWTHDRFMAYQAKVHLSSGQWLRHCNSQLICSSFMSILVFAVVFTIAMVNPDGFQTVLEKFASFMLNLHSGFFLFLMIRKATSNSGYGYLNIPLPLPAFFLHLQFCLPLYFGFAVGYDIYTIAHAISGS